jgi:hypothetical protein
MTEPRRIGGWIKDRYDGRDYLYRVAPRVALPTVIDLNSQLPRDKNGKVLVRSQKSSSACVGFGLGVNACSVAVKLGIFNEWYSPKWIYNGARFIEGTLAQDIGSYPKDGLDWMLENGILFEHDWPYEPNYFDKTAPGSTRIALAVKYPDFRYERVVDGVNGILTALNDGHMVSIGTPWFSKWNTVETDNTGVLPEVEIDDNVEGGHETALFK